MSRIRLLLVVISTFFFLACASDVPPDLLEEPTELSEVEAQFAVKKNWSVNVGYGTGKQRLKFVPALTADEVYAADYKGRIWAIDRKTGKKLWKKDLQKLLSAGPGVRGDRLYLATQEGQLLSLARQDGRLLWSAQLDSELLAIPLATDEQLFAATIDGQIYGLNPTDGSVLWRYATRVPPLTLRGSSGPVLIDNLLLYGAADGRLVALNKISGLPVWDVTISVAEGRSELERIVDIDADPVVFDDTIFVVTYQGHVAAVDAGSGVLLWRREMSSFSGLQVANGELYVTDSSGQIWSLSRRTGAALWKQDGLMFRDLTAPAFHNGLIVVGDKEGYLHWLSADNGDFLARDRIGNDRWLSPMRAVDNELIALSETGKLISLYLE